MKPDWRSTSEAFPVLILEPSAAVHASRLAPRAVELRIDLFVPMPDRRIRAFLHSLPRRPSLLVTARTERDGGAWRAADEEVRRGALLAWAPIADAVDAEVVLADSREGRGFLRSLRAALRPGRALILSHHDLEEIPGDRELDRLLLRARRNGADRFKIAGRAKTMKEAERLADWALARTSACLPVTAIAMGEEGAWTRWVLPLSLGGPAYAPARAGRRAVAPGQISFRALSRLLRTP